MKMINVLILIIFIFITLSSCVSLTTSMHTYDNLVVFYILKHPQYEGELLKMIMEIQFTGNYPELSSNVEYPLAVFRNVPSGERTIGKFTFKGTSSHFALYSQYSINIKKKL